MCLFLFLKFCWCSKNITNWLQYLCQRQHCFYLSKMEHAAIYLNKTKVVVFVQYFFIVNKMGEILFFHYLLYSLLHPLKMHYNLLNTDDSCIKTKTMRSLDFFH